MHTCPVEAIYSAKVGLAQVVSISEHRSHMLGVVAASHNLQSTAGQRSRGHKAGLRNCNPTSGHRHAYCFPIAMELLIQPQEVHTKAGDSRSSLSMFPVLSWNRSLFAAPSSRRPHLALSAGQYGLTDSRKLQYKYGSH